MKSTRIVIAVLSILVAILGGIASNRLQVYLKGYEDWIWIPFVVLAAVFIFLELHEKQQERSGTRSDDLASRNRRAMIEKVRAIWITGVLNRSLYKETLITLGLSERPDAVERPMDILVQRPDKADYPLPPGTRVVDVYDELGGSLLILGAPGSGKTTLLTFPFHHLRQVSCGFPHYTP
jgi:hypothetical protein